MALVHQGIADNGGALGIQIIRKSPETKRAEAIFNGWRPRSNLGIAVARALPLLPRDLAEDIVEKFRGALVAESALRMKVFRANGRVDDLGLVGTKVVTTVGAGYIIDAMQNLTEPENMKYHSLGTGSTAEAAADTGLVTELTTEYNPNSTRATGTTTEASATVYRTVATNTLDGTPGAALREHGIHSAASAGVLFDRTVYAALTVSAGDGIQTTYDWTLNTGG